MGEAGRGGGGDDQRGWGGQPEGAGHAGRGEGALHGQLMINAVCSASDRVPSTHPLRLKAILRLSHAVREEVVQVGRSAVLSRDILAVFPRRGGVRDVASRGLCPAGQRSRGIHGPGARRGRRWPHPGGRHIYLLMIWGAPGPGALSLCDARGLARKNQKFRVRASLFIASRRCEQSNCIIFATVSKPSLYIAPWRTNSPPPRMSPSQPTPQRRWTSTPPGL